jgi:hypothetical protein
MIKRPEVHLDLKGPDGNSMAVIAACVRMAKISNWPKETIEAFKTEAMCWDRKHLLDVVFECFEVYAIHLTSTKTERWQAQ